jgi:membrane-bound ClpP family serine protease
VSDKVVNDAAAYAEAIAELRGRNTEVAVDMVREGRSLRIVDVDGLDLIVEPCAETDTADIDQLVVERHRRATTIESPSRTERPRTDAPSAKPCCTGSSPR